MESRTGLISISDSIPELPTPFGQTSATHKVSCSLSDLSRITRIARYELQRYERLGVLGKADTSGITSRRKYGLTNLRNLEKLIFLEFLGASAKQFVNSPKSRDLISELQSQHDVLVEIRKRLNKVIYFVEHAQVINRYSASNDWDSLAILVDVIRKCSVAGELQQRYISGDHTCDLSGAVGKLDDMIEEPQKRD